MQFWITFWVTWEIGICMSYAIAAASPNLDAANALGEPRAPRAGVRV
jgi:hypothetical protein